MLWAWFCCGTETGMDHLTFWDLSGRVAVTLYSPVWFLTQTNNSFPLYQNVSCATKDRLPEHSCPSLLLLDSWGLVGFFSINYTRWEGSYSFAAFFCIVTLCISLKPNFSSLPCSFRACTKQLSLKFLEVWCNHSNGREHLGVQRVPKTNNSNNNTNSSEAMEAQGCCDFEHAGVLFWNCNSRKPPSPDS